MKGYLVQEGSSSYGSGNKITSSKLFETEFVAWYYIFKNKLSRGKVYEVTNTEPARRINKPTNLK